MSKLPKILIAAPTIKEKDYCADEWIEQVLGFDYPNYEVILVDNSADKGYYKKLIRKGIKTFHVDRKGKTPFQFLAESQEVIRWYALEGGFSSILMLESDVFIDKHIPMKMVLANKPVYNITYMIDLYKNGNFMPCLQHTYMYAGRMEAQMVEQFTYFEGKVKRINSYGIGGSFMLTHSGLGCTMIRRDVFSKIPFQCEKDKFTDSVYHAQLFVQDIPNYLDTEYIAKHKVNPVKQFKMTL